jgi:flagellar protein FliO/FliZ
MPNLNEYIFASRASTAAALAIASLAAVILSSLIFHFAYRRRLRLPRNGRARQPRLGVVDAFNLDGRRQLVIVRRDNVEHLLMLGGPNDLVVESEIIRAESRDSRAARETRLRNKEQRETEQREPLPVPAGVSWPYPTDDSPPAPLQGTAPPPGAKTEQQAGAARPAGEPMPAFPPVIAPPVQKPSASPVAPRGGPPPVNNELGPRPAAQRKLPQGRTKPPPIRETGLSLDRRLPEAAGPSVFLRFPPQRSKDGTPAEPKPPGGAERSPADAQVQPSSDSVAAALSRQHEVVAPAPAMLELSLPPVRALEGPAAAAGPVQADADPIEEQMARLLGRGPG